LENGKWKQGSNWTNQEISCQRNRRYILVDPEERRRGAGDISSPLPRPVRLLVSEGRVDPSACSLPSGALPGVIFIRCLRSSTRLAFEIMRESPPSVVWILASAKTQGVVPRTGGAVEARFRGVGEMALRGSGTV